MWDDRTSFGRRCLLGVTDRAAKATARLRSMHARVTALMRRLRSPLTNLALLVIATGVAVLLCEALVRAAAPQQLILIRPDLWRPADTVGWLHHPNVTVEMNTGERTVTIRTDSEGFRVGAEGPRTAGRQVLLLGDSYMEALQVEYEQSVAGILEEVLPDLVGEPVAVRNAGVGGWNLEQSALRARSLLTRGDYDLVLTAAFLRNDIQSERRGYYAPRARTTRHRFRIPRRIEWAEIEEALLLPINDVLEVRSHLFLFFRNRLQTLRMQLGLYPLDFPRAFLRSAADDPGWAVTADILAAIDGMAAEHGAQAVVAFVPEPIQVDSTRFLQYVDGFHLDPSTVDLDQPNRLLAGELASNGVAFYDPLEAFRAASRDGRQLFGSVDPHFSPEGNELFATLLAPVVASLLTDSAEPSDEPRAP